MHFHPVYGLYAPEKGWVPAPRYLLRRQRVLSLLKRQPRGHLLEIGCGSGALLYDLARLGFSCTALEPSSPALSLARQFNRSIPETQIHETPQPQWASAYDYLLALEVLEHLECEHSFLENCHHWLKPGGLMTLSVPAHPLRWNATDVWAGHYRRYRQEELKNLLVEAGFSIIHFECYGFPLANIIEPVRARHHARSMKSQEKGSDRRLSLEARSGRSGIERSLEVRLFPYLSRWAGVKIMQSAFYLQELFSQTDWGNGYLVLAEKTG